MKSTAIAVPSPQLQVDFSFALAQIRSLYLQDALFATIETMDVGVVDRELNKLVPKQKLQALARHGLRGELLFPVPAVLSANPRLLGYYRLLLGFSQKAFYAGETGLGVFRGMEERGSLSKTAQDRLPELCKNLISAASHFLDGIGADRVSKGLFDDLTLLTIGPQLRGGANVKIGAAAIVKVFEIIHEIVRHAVIDSNPNRIEIKNAAGRKVLIEFAPDPDIIIREEIAANVFRNVIAIEIKGGTDFSNIHNRIGEAEKSHQKARLVGYHECWTVVNVDRIDLVMAKQESPSTNRFYGVSKLQNLASEEYSDFRNRVVSLTGIANS
ncbi:MAG: restriction endonuclease [Desulfuromonadales bacterium GWD2_61_12]|nr:MAG: restriction endonuclease [Desulfuromonadales bacterium GWD2_61_12]